MLNLLAKKMRIMFLVTVNDFLIPITSLDIFKPMPRSWMLYSQVQVGDTGREYCGMAGSGSGSRSKC